ncbi:hypothetical protein WME75_36890 [Sorangium sp. So ce1014]|uniref:hypothetical protein n=1 Tax=Sorangium sp. So ce1014 TaxID=3133326 RepID=UPI003F640E4A
MKPALALSAALIATSLSIGEASAYSVFATCFGDDVIWDEHPYVPHHNTFSIPIGSVREEALVNAINQWNGVRGMNDAIQARTFNSGSTIVHGDDLSDVAIMNRADIGGNNGLTMPWSDGCFLGDEDWTEADVMLASDLTIFTNPSETLLGNTGRQTYLHELGHALGLADHQAYNIMRIPQPRPLLGGPGEHVDVLPDDANGGRYLYPSGNSETNLFASAHFRNSSTDVIGLNWAETVIACSGGGGQMNLPATVGNNGTVNVTQTERWFVSINQTAYGGIQIGEWGNGTFLAGTAHTRSVPITLPPLAVGTYFVFHAVDVLNVASETREDDNVVREAFVLEVISC